MSHHFERTVCGCRECVDCCKSQPGPLAPGQLEAIAAHLGKSLEDVKPDFVASPGALVGTTNGAVFRVGTITPRSVDGRCVFLDENERCSIHAVAPFGCAYFDTHMPSTEAKTRGVWLVRQQMDETYQDLRASLRPSQTWKPTGYRSPAPAKKIV